MRATKPVSNRFRRLVLSALMVLAPLVATAAAAWACAPAARLTLDKSAYEAGGAIIANGGGFPSNATVSVTLAEAGPADSGPGNSGPTVSTTTVNASEAGVFSATLTAPMTPGNYTLTATHPSGGFAPAAFSVIAAPPPPPQAPPPTAPPSAAPTPVAVTPEPPAALPSAVFAPDLAGPALLRQTRPNEAVLVSRTGVLEVFCGRLGTGQVRGSCGAASTRMRAGGTAPLIELRPKAFRADAGGRVVIRFHLKARALRAIRAARRVRMRGTVVAVGANGTATTKSFVFTLKAPRPMRR